MPPDSPDRSDLLKAVFDAVPSLVFVVDEDVRIQEYNAAASAFLLGAGDTMLRRRCGDVFECLHSMEGPGGCGDAELCRHCTIRNSVAAAMAGDRVVRRRATIEVVRNGEEQEVFALITASRFRFRDRKFVLLVIEDISEIAELRGIIPICSVCKEVQDEGDAWSRLEVYFWEHWGLEFSHGLCPKCYEAELAKLDEEEGVC